MTAGREVGLDVGFGDGEIVGTELGFVCATAKLSEFLTLPTVTFRLTVAVVAMPLSFETDFND